MTLTELRRLEAAATRGPWKEHGSCRSIQARCFDGTWKIVADRIRGGTPGQAHANRQLLVALRNAAPALLEIAERAKAYKEAHDRRLAYDATVETDEWDEERSMELTCERREMRVALFAAVEKLEAQ